MSFTSFLSDRGSKQAPAPSAEASSYLQSASFAQPSASSSSSSFVPDQPQQAQEPTAQSLFASAAFDPAKLHPLAGLGSDQQLDYLLLEDDKTNLEGGAVMGNRGFFDDVQAGTGTAYITGSSLADPTPSLGWDLSPGSTADRRASRLPSTRSLLG
jgi:import inner membrane translocase subunit TIM23